MRKMVLFMICVLLLCGCGARPTVETVADEWVEEAMAPAREILVQLPQEAAVPTIEGTDGRLYLCDDYELAIRTVEGGDLDATVRELSGYGRDELTVIQSDRDGVARYDLVWTAVGEGGDALGRAVILDDGTWHYTMSVLRPAETTETTQIVWRSVFESFTLA